MAAAAVAGGGGAGIVAADRTWAVLRISVEGGEIFREAGMACRVVRGI